MVERLCLLFVCPTLISLLDSSHPTLFQRMKISARDKVDQEWRAHSMSPFSDILEHHLLNLIQTHVIRSPVIQLGRPRALMGRHLLRLLKIPAIGQVDGDPGRPEPCRNTRYLGLAGSSLEQ
jgi:hypothetical protein